MRYQGCGQKSVSGNRGRRGMTLIELIIAMGIFAIAALSCLAVLLTSVERNRSTRLTVAATSAARQTIEETMAMADSAVVESSASAEVDISKPMELCRYLLSTKLDDGFEVVPEGNPVRRLVCHFPAMVPGESARTAEGVKRFIAGGTPGLPAGTIVAEATMTVYLDESQVPVTLGGEVEPMWRDLSKGAADDGLAGFDINGDGIIQTGGMISDSREPQFVMKDVPASHQRLAQLPVDVMLVYYYQDPGQNPDRTQDTRGRQTHTYRLIVSDLE